MTDGRDDIDKNKIQPGSEAAEPTPESVTDDEALENEEADLEGEDAEEGDFDDARFRSCGAVTGVGDGRRSARS